VASKLTNWGYDVAFTGMLSGTDVPLLVADHSGLSAGATVTVTPLVQGSSGVARDEPAPKQKTVAELKAELDARGIEYPSSALKADLIRLSRTRHEHPERSLRVRRRRGLVTSYLLALVATAQTNPGRPDLAWPGKGGGAVTEDRPAVTAPLHPPGPRQAGTHRVTPLSRNSFRHP